MGTDAQRVAEGPDGTVDSASRRESCCASLLLSAEGSDRFLSFLYFWIAISSDAAPNFIEIHLSHAADSGVALYPGEKQTFTDNPHVCQSRVTNGV